MIYCVIKGTVKVIDSNQNTEENMLMAIQSAGFEKDEVEFIDEIEFNQRKESEPKPVKEFSFEDSQIKYNVDIDYRLSLIEMGLV